ncbi:hypothetical protein AB0383_48760 [Amycolatopsis sp. NPDC051373]|uniref:hypothetical protein n=1 Tax=Amycolatopsis sp. NPDC051373 TaxID=3155801 RepID=UPI00344FD6B2
MIMVLSRRAQEFAAEIREHDWCDAPFRLDRAGHKRASDSNIGTAPELDPEQTDAVRTNVMWVVAQVLGYQEGPSFNSYEFADACGVRTLTKYGQPDGYITAGLRLNSYTGEYVIPGTPASFDTKDVVCGQSIWQPESERGQLCRRTRGHDGQHTVRSVYDV